VIHEVVAIWYLNELNYEEKRYRTDFRRYGTPRAFSMTSPPKGFAITFNIADAIGYNGRSVTDQQKRLRLLCG
jgi:hypothetical protein